MHAFFIERYGQETGRLGQVPEPQMQAHEVLVQVHASSINLLDAKIAQGEFKWILPFRLPLVLGNDLAGVVLRVGAEVRRFKPGDEVYGSPPQARIGTFAERIAVADRSYPLASTAEALKYIGQGRAKGKVVITL